MIEINIAKDFTTEPGARTYDDGPYSGQEFYDLLLEPKFAEAIKRQVKLKIILDGTEGFASSFLNEAFIRLGDKYGSDVVWNNIILISEEIPKYITKVKESIYEKRK
ncbi:MAG: STAS-like domain-containing protein [Bacteroidia bacterium]|nr:STAS-like domain-containing protein [Bacteroidia bacterium]